MSVQRFRREVLY